MKRFAAAQCFVRISFASLSKASISFSVWPVARPRLSHPQSRNLLPRVSDIAFAHNLAHPIDLAQHAFAPNTATFYWPVSGSASLLELRAVGNHETTIDLPFNAFVPRPVTL
jgi:hypothetical protein